MNLTWDLGIGIAAAVIFAYYFLIRRHKALATLVSVYIAYMVALVWGDPLAAIFTGDRVIFNSIWVQGDITPYLVKIALFLLLVIMLSTFLKLGGRRNRYGAPETVGYTLCVVALLLTLTVLLTPAATQTFLSHRSHIIDFLLEWKNWVEVVPVFIMIYFGIYGEED